MNRIQKCNDKNCKIKKKHYHLPQESIDTKLAVTKGLSYCCLSKIHVEVSYSNKMCCLACKKCSIGLSGSGVIILI